MHKFGISAAGGQRGGVTSTNQTTTDEKNGDCNVLQVFCFPFTTPTVEMFKEDVGRSVEEDKRAFDELG